VANVWCIDNISTPALCNNHRIVSRLVMELYGLLLGAPIILRGLYNALFFRTFFYSKLHFCEGLMVWGLNPLISLEWLYAVY